MKRIAMIGMLAAGVLLAGPALASELMIYPNQGQSTEQQEQDKYQCYSWAKEQSGFDPMAPPTATEPPPAKEEERGGAGKGALKGAVGGLAIGAIAGDAGKGAAIGAGSGALIGGVRRNSQVKREQHKREQWERQQVQQYSKNRNNYNRAYAACLEGRGYTVR